MISIDQLLESVDLDFEPRWVTKDKDGTITIFKTKPKKGYDVWVFGSREEYFILNKFKVAEFADKPWQDCIYEVPRKGKPVVKIERFTYEDFECVPNVYGATEKVMGASCLDKLNGLVDMVNNIISVQEKMIDSRFVVNAVNELKGAKNE